MGDPVTIVRLGSGEVKLRMSLDDVRRALQKALRQNVLLEFDSADGDTIVVNPYQVQCLQPAERQASA